jgi:hypothetical protein
MEFTRKKMVQAFEAARECGPYDELPVLVEDRDPQLHLSRNDRPQPFHLICSRDTLIAQLSGTATLYLEYSPVRYHRLEPGDVVYVPAGTPTRLVPDDESVNLRYKALHPGYEGVGWFCEDCGRELHRVEFDGDCSIPQEEYWKACEAFNSDPALRRCGECGAEHTLVDLSGIRWLEVAEAIRESS